MSELASVGQRRELVTEDVQLSMWRQRRRKPCNNNDIKGCNGGGKDAPCPGCLQKFGEQLLLEGRSQIPHLHGTSLGHCALLGLVDRQGEEERVERALGGILGDEALRQCKGSALGHGSDGGELQDDVPALWVTVVFF